MKYFIAITTLMASAGVFAQVTPDLSMDDPRIQTIAWQPSGHYRLSLFPDAGLMLVLSSNDRLQSITLSDPNAFAVRAASSNDSIEIHALNPDAKASLQVDTSRGRYVFELGTTKGIMAAYIVRFVEAAADSNITNIVEAHKEGASSETFSYRLSGETLLRPTSIFDNGHQTHIEWGVHQMLPAVFGIGPTGEEEVVDGYMRGGIFVVDRVYSELVFRMDKLRAKARRESKSK